MQADAASNSAPDPACTLSIPPAMERAIPNDREMQGMPPFCEIKVSMNINKPFPPCQGKNSQFLSCRFSRIPGLRMDS